MQSPIIFWIAWGIISFWALKTFYYSFSKDKVERLRKAALGIHLSVLALSFLPWLPPLIGKIGGQTLEPQGIIFPALFVVLLIVSIALFLAKDALLLKFASIATVVNTCILFIFMMQIRPGTFVLTLNDIAPIIAIMLLLVCDIVVLLLWQQLQLKEKKKGSVRFDKRLLIGIVLVLIFVGGWVLVVKNKTNHPQNPQYSREIISTKFTSKESGYTISYPTDWTIDTSRSQAPADIITNNTGDTQVFIQTIDDQRLLKKGGETQVANDVKQGFVDNANYILEEFKQRLFDGIPAYFAKGSFKDNKGEWNFVEYTILAGGERIYIVRVNTKKNTTPSAKDAVKNIVASFSLVPNHTVALLPEVEKFESAVIKNGRSKFGIWVDSWPSTNNPYYTVQVFETFPDHRTTFNWYRVSQKDGKVYRQNIAKDTWEEVSK